MHAGKTGAEVAGRAPLDLRNDSWGKVAADNPIRRAIEAQFKELVESRGCELSFPDFEGGFAICVKVLFSELSDPLEEEISERAQDKLDRTKEYEKFAKDLFKKMLIERDLLWARQNKPK